MVFTATGCGSTDAQSAEITASAPVTSTTTAAPQSSTTTSVAAATAPIPADATEPAPNSNPAIPTDTAPQSSQASASADLMLTDVRVGQHPGFDRVVYEFAGTGTPGWRARYVDGAFQDNSGKPISVAGDGILQIYINRIAFPSDDTETGSFPLVPGASGGVVTEVREGVSWSEGDMQSFIGTARPQRPFTVFTLSEPTRVVVDIAT
ncbi:hypothetical protein EF834_00245 [Rhodococcus spongiicola]|uniref:AMIN-like domain-containing protein n=2 Tax=Rhodococcus spongiicola TaxID=2487352 RepID=A0A3S3E5Q1_9NOCA|nr:hypothetical protein EF834_00245 [Rhodococcus spongiicola]